MKCGVWFLLSWEVWLDIGPSGACSLKVFISILFCLFVFNPFYLLIYFGPQEPDSQNTRGG